MRDGTEKAELRQLIESFFRKVGPEQCHLKELVLTGGHRMDLDAERVETLLTNQEALVVIRGVTCGTASLQLGNQVLPCSCSLEPILSEFHCLQMIGWLECILFPNDFLVSKERTLKLWYTHPQELLSMYLQKWISWVRHKWSYAEKIYNSWFMPMPSLTRHCYLIVQISQAFIFSWFFSLYWLNGEERNISLLWDNCMGACWQLKVCHCLGMSGFALGVTWYRTGSCRLCYHIHSVPALPLNSCVTLGRLYHFSEPWVSSYLFLIFHIPCKIIIKIGDNIWEVPQHSAWNPVGTSPVWLQCQHYLDHLYLTGF